MIKLILQIVCFSLSLQAFALEKTGVAWLRETNGKKLKKQTVVLRDLISEERVEGKYFKIVYATSPEAISFSDKEFGEAATHAYYHAALAREFFINNFPADYVKSLPPIIIRLNMTNAFNDTNHWVDGELSQEFNNALSVPASIDESRHPKVAPWGPEIWFRPGKEVELDNGVYLTAEALQDKQIKQSFYLSIAQSTAMQIAQSLGHSYWNFSQVDFTAHLATLAISLGVVEVLPRLVAVTSKHIKRKVYIDTVKFPEVIYHEFAHIAFSNLLPLNNFNPVIEGYANYFAGLMTNYHKLMYRGGEFSRGLTGKNSFKKIKYDYSLELPVMAQSSFTFKLLNELKVKLGSTVFNQLLIQAATHPNVHENIKYNLINAIFDSVDELNFIRPEDKMSLKFQVHQVIQELNL